MGDIIVIAILACVIAGVIFYIYREKKRGAKCLGCPYAKQCGGKCNGSCDNTSADDANKDK